MPTNRPTLLSLVICVWLSISSLCATANAENVIGFDLRPLAARALLADDNIWAPGALVRFPPITNDWLLMPTDSSGTSRSYVRDEKVGWVLDFNDAHHGDSWLMQWNLPAPYGALDGGEIRFLDEYDGKSLVFVWIYNSAWSVITYGTRSFYARWWLEIPFDTNVRPFKPIGRWQMAQLFKPNEASDYTVIRSDEFDLLPQVETSTVAAFVKDAMPQLTQKLAAYDTVYLGNSGKSLNVYGCTVSSMAMVLSYHMGRVITPKNLVDFLNRPTDPENPLSPAIGFDSDGNIIWPIAASYSETNGGPYVYWNGVVRRVPPETFTIPWLPNQAPADPLLEKWIFQHGPAIYKFRKWGLFGSHYVAGFGKTSDLSDFYFVDPYYGAYIYTMGTAIWTGPSWLGWEFSHVFRSSATSKPTERAFFKIRLHSPAELVLVDPNGRKIGYDPITDTHYTGQFEKGYYDFHGTTFLGEDPYDIPDEPIERIIEIGAPADGDYELSVIGTGDGTYNLEVLALDQELGRSNSSVQNIPISEGTVHRYILSYSKTAGSTPVFAGQFFAGKGQRPRDVNKFLSYIAPTEARTTLPVGVRQFELVVAYGTNTIPSSFSATLNGNDISSLFSPSSQTVEVVNVPLEDGRNTLILSTEGTLDGGRVARDTDRLVFLTQ